MKLSIADRLVAFNIKLTQSPATFANKTNFIYVGHSPMNALGIHFYA